MSKSNPILPPANHTATPESPNLTDALTELLTLADRATDTAPSVTLTLAEGWYEAAACGCAPVRGKTVDEAVARLAVRLVETLKVRIEGDREAVRSFSRTLSGLERALQAGSTGRQLPLPLLMESAKTEH